jgi:hypothetical protein
MIGFPRSRTEGRLGYDDETQRLEISREVTLLGRTADCYEPSPDPFQGSFEICIDASGVVLSSTVNDRSETISLEALSSTEEVDPQDFQLATLP